MRKYILILLAGILLSSCGENSAQPASSEKTLPSGIAVDFSQEVNGALKEIGFVLPSEEIKAPDISIFDLQGTRRSLSDYRGKVVLLNFWGVWCYYCREEMPSIQRLYDKLKSEDFVVVAVNVQDSQDTARKFIEDNHLTLPVILDKELIATRMYGIRGFPTTFLIDKDGTMRAMYVGSREWDAENVLAVMRSLLNK